MTTPSCGACRVFLNIFSTFDERRPHEQCDRLLRLLRLLQCCVLLFDGLTFIILWIRVGQVCCMCRGPAHKGQGCETPERILLHEVYIAFLIVWLTWSSLYPAVYVRACHILAVPRQWHSTLVIIDPSAWTLAVP